MAGKKKLVLFGRGRGPKVPVEGVPVLEVTGLLKGEEAELLYTNIAIVENGDIELFESMEFVCVRYEGENPNFICNVRHD